MKRLEVFKNDNGFSKDAVSIKDSHLGVVVSHVFGQDSLETIFSSNYFGGKTQKEVLQNVNFWVSKTLDEIQPSTTLCNEDKRPGRVGIPQVRFDSTVQMGTMVMSPDRCHAQAYSNFSTVRTNVCCFSGKWQYEIHLESQGVMQLGWSKNEAQFTSETGVGDTIHSYAYDGNRIRKWNLVTTEYGEAWQSGDIIGSTIDLDIGSIHFYRNGKDLGEAFSSIPLGPGCVYYPAVSLAYDEKVGANFGATPFQYPVESFLPLQLPPIGAVLRTNKLLYWLSRISNMPSESHSIKGESSTGIKSSPEVINLLLSEILVKHLSEYLSQPYVVSACLVPFLHDSMTMDMDKNNLLINRSFVKVNTFFNCLSLMLEPDDFKGVVNAICKCLVLKFNQTSVSLDYKIQKYVLAVLSEICQITCVRKTLLKQHDFLKSRVCYFMVVKPIDICGLKQCVPQPWWESDELQDSERKRQLYIASCELIKEKTSEVERLQEDLLKELLNNNDGTTTDASSRKYFLCLLRMFLKDNHVTNVLSQNTETTPLPIALSFFHRMVSVIRSLWVKECLIDPVYVPTSMFYNGKVDYWSIERMGGVLSHMINTQRTTLVEELGEDHTLFTAPAAAASAQPTLQVQIRAVDPSTGVMSSLTRWFSLPLTEQSSERPAVESVTPSPVSSTDSLLELLDGAIMLYDLAAHKQLHKVSMIRDDMDKYIRAYNEARERRSVAEEKYPEAVSQIQYSIQVLEQKLDEQSQMVMAWVRGSIYTPDKRSNLVWLLKAALVSLNRASGKENKFGFVPEFYLDTVVEICAALRNYFHPTLPLEDWSGYDSLMVHVAEFLANHFRDPRIVNPHSKDKINEAIASYVIKKETLDYLENISITSQERFIGVLLKQYVTETWAHNNWFLMRLWQGDGFAFRYKTSPHLNGKFGPSTANAEPSLHLQNAFEPCPSAHYQKLVSRCLSQNQELATEFLNSILKQLNWTLSELISILQEIQNLSKRPQRVIVDARQMKMCSTLYDIVVASLRVVEMICSMCLDVFTENMLERLSQSLGQILLRVTSSSGTFSQVVSMEIPDLDSIDQFPVLAAVAGVLIAVFAEDISKSDGPKISNMSSRARCFLSEPSFDIESLRYLLGESESGGKKKNRFSFENYPDVVSPTEVQTVRKMISVLSKYKASMSISKEFEDAELCPICYAMPLSVTFIPCHHQSCKSCITHHLMDCKKCFFCQKDIMSVVTTEGQVLFDFNAASLP